LPLRGPAHSPFARKVFGATTALFTVASFAAALLVIPSSPALAATSSCDTATSQTLCSTSLHLEAAKNQTGEFVVITGKASPATHDGEVVLYQVQKSSEMQLGTGVLIHANGAFTLRESLADGGRFGTAVYLVEYNPTGSYSPSQAKINIHVSK
jgi:hypothetical protein